MSIEAHPDLSLTRGLPIISIDMVKRATVIAIAIGLILNVINQGPALLAGDPLSPLSAILVFASPFFVVLISQMIATRHALKTAPAGHSNTASFVEMLLGHGFLATALMIAMTSVSINTVLIAGNNFATTAQIGPLALPVLAQAFVLPLVFSVLSLTQTYRRTMRTLQNINLGNHLERKPS
jgi:hypothetical protein